MMSNIIYETISTIDSNLNIVFPDTNKVIDINDYLDTVLNIVRNPKYVPISWYDERLDLTERIDKARTEIESNECSYVRGDSFGDGMPHGQSDPTSQEKKYLRRIELRETIKELEDRLSKVNIKIASVDREFDTNIKDYVKEVIELVPNERYKDIMKQFYIYRKSYRLIAKESFLSEESVKVYRKRGFKMLSDIFYDYSIKIH